jgi:hypothetical protein
LKIILSAFCAAVVIPLRACRTSDPARRKGLGA